MDSSIGGPLVGREAEREVLSALVTRARSGEGDSAAVIGPAGVGKSALLQELSRSAATEGLAVADLVGTEAESGWAYAGLHMMLSAVAGVTSPDDRTEVTAWAESFIRQATEHTPPYDMALHVQRLVEQITSPTVIVVDDAHLLDTHSRHVLGFVARRLRSVPVVLVVSTALSAAGAAQFAGLRALHLPELSRLQAITLVRRAADERITDRAAEHIVANVGGNPRALLDVVQRVPAEQRQGVAELDRRLPQSDVLQELFLPELGSLDDDRRFALLVAALSEDRRFGPVVAVLSDRGERLPAWLARHHLNIADGTFSFRKPAVRSVIWHASGLDQRAQAHLALADVYADLDPDHNLWHRAQATQEHDETLAERLQQAAAEARARGQHDKSAAFARQSVRLAADSADQADRLVLSGQLALQAGRIPDTVRIARDRSRFETTPEQRADLVYLEAYARNLDDGHVARGLLARYAEEVREVDENRAARLCLLAARQFAERMELDEANYFVALVERYQTDFDEPTLSLYRSTWAWLAVLKGDRDQALALINADAAADGQGFEAGERSLCRANVLIHVGRYDTARAVLHGITKDRGYGNSPVLLAAAYAALTTLELKAGRLIAAKEAATAMEHTVAKEWSCSGRVAASLIRVHALLGEADEAWARQEQAFARVQRSGEWGTAAALQAETGLLLLLLGRLDSALPILDCARGYSLQLADPSLLQTEPDFIETCVRLGELDSARQAVEELDLRVQKCPSPWGHAVLARCQALVADDDSALSLFREAVDACADGVSPLELGRTQLCFAERLRRTGRRNEARMWLDQAIVRFRECGALALVTRAERELAGVGDRSWTNSRGDDDVLTVAEHRVAALAAAGLRNREIATELFVSLRTVESHLTQVFRKLGIRSRTELAGIVLDDTVVPQDAQQWSGEIK